MTYYAFTCDIKTYIVLFMRKNIEMEVFCKELGMRLRKVRIARNKTQKELGAMAGVSTKVIGRMERGDVSVSLAKWLIVTAMLGVFSTWQDVLLIAEDPFEVYDREQKEVTDLLKKRVRHKKK